MGRSLGSPNVNEYHWEFRLYSPANLEHVVWSEMYTTIYEMHECLQQCFSLSQIKSYASKSRRSPKNIEIRRICIPVSQVQREDSTVK